MNNLEKLANLVLILFFANAVFAVNPPKGKTAIITSEFIYKKQEVSFPSCHASTIAETPEGMIAAWFGGTEERNPDVCIYTSS
ncbi:MAG TPA: hypothetical protein VGK38_07380, partial [Prolixibacteraceae bacterium]